MSQYGCLLPPPDFTDLTTKYDINEDGRFHYSDFLRHFMLSVKSGDQRVPSRQEKTPNKKLYVSDALSSFQLRSNTMSISSHHFKFVHAILLDFFIINCTKQINIKKKENVSKIINVIFLKEKNRKVIRI